MKRTTVMLDEDVYARLKTLAQHKGVTGGAMIREAVAVYVAAGAGSDLSPLAPLIGLFDGPDEDLGAQVEDILWATMAKGLEPGEAHEVDR